MAMEITVEVQQALAIKAGKAAWGDLSLTLTDEFLASLSQEDRDLLARIIHKDTRAGKDRSAYVLNTPYFLSFHFTFAEPTCEALREQLARYHTFVVENTARQEQLELEKKQREADQKARELEKKLHYLEHAPIEKILQDYSDPTLPRIKLLAEHFPQRFEAYTQAKQALELAKMKAQEEKEHAQEEIALAAARHPKYARAAAEGYPVDRAYVNYVWEELKNTFFESYEGIDMDLNRGEIRSAPSEGAFATYDELNKIVEGMKTAFPPHTQVNVHKIKRATIGGQPTTYVGVKYSCPPLDIFHTIAIVAE